MTSVPGVKHRDPWMFQLGGAGYDCAQIRNLTGGGERGSGIEAESSRRPQTGSQPQPIAGAGPVYEQGCRCTAPENKAVGFAKTPMEPCARSEL